MNTTTIIVLAENSMRIMTGHVAVPAERITNIRIMNIMNTTAAAVMRTERMRAGCC